VEMVTRLHRVQGGNHLRAGRPVQAIACYERAIAMGRLHDDRQGITQALAWLGRAQVATGRLLEAATTLCEAVELGEAMRDPRTTGTALALLGRLKIEDGDLVHAGALLDRAHECHQRIGLAYSAARFRVWRGHVH